MSYLILVLNNVSTIGLELAIASKFAQYFHISSDLYTALYCTFLLRSVHIISKAILFYETHYLKHAFHLGFSLSF